MRFSSTPCHSWIAATAATIFLVAQAPTLSPAPITAESLKGKSDKELLEIVAGQRVLALQKANDEYQQERKVSSLDRLWEMPAREAAVAFVSDYASKEVAGITYEIDEPNAKPPAKGEIGLRWISANEYGPREEGVTILKYNGYLSELLLSKVEIVGRPSKQEIESAVMKTDAHPIRRLVAQQTYEILWWLRHVRVVGQPDIDAGAELSFSDDFGRFWMKPDGPVVEKARFGEPCGQCMDDKAKASYDAFAAALMRRLKERSGLQERYPIPKIVRLIDNDPDSIFLRTQPPPIGNAPETRKKWVGRLLEILQNPKRDFLYDAVMENLVPISDPLRYDDDRIDVALLDVLRRCEKAAAAIPDPQERVHEGILEVPAFPTAKAEHQAMKQEQVRLEKERALRHRKGELTSKAKVAAEKLGLHGAASALPDVLRLAPTEAAEIVGRHPELRPALVEYLRPLMGESATWPCDPIEIIWRADLRQLAPWLENLANHKTAAAQDSSWQFAGAADRAKGILLAWSETDPLTKTKLDILLTGHIGQAASIPEVLRVEFQGLPNEDQVSIRNFVSSLRTIGAPWSMRYIENVFTPHTPRPDLLFEQ